MKYAATIKDCRQYSEDSWEAITRIKEITEETTLKELIDWQKQIYPKNDSIQKDNYLEPIQILRTE